MHEYQNIENDNKFSFKLFKEYCKRNKPNSFDIKKYIDICYHISKNKYKPLPERFLIYLLKNYYSKSMFKSYEQFYRYSNIPSHILKLLNKD